MKIYTLVTLPIHLVANLESSVTYLHKNYAAFTFTATQQLRRIRICLNYSRQIKHRKCEHFLSRRKRSKCLASPSRTLSSYL